MLAVLLTVGLAEILLRTSVIPSVESRWRRIDIDNPKAKERLLIVGDSFFAKNREINDILINKIQSSGRKVHLLNLAQAGDNPYDYLDKLLHWGSDFRPTTVLVSVYVGNDLIEMARTEPRFKKSTWLKLPVFFQFEYEQTQWPELDRQRLTNIGIDEKMIKAAKNREINPWLLAKSLDHPNYLLDTILFENKTMIDNWQKTREVLLKIKKLSEAGSFEFRMVIFPRSIQISRELFPFYQKSNSILMKRLSIQITPSNG